MYRQRIPPIVILVLWVLALLAAPAPGQTFVSSPEAVVANQHLPNPSLAAGHAGSVILAWCSIPDGVKAVSSTDWGVTWSPPAPVCGGTPYTINQSPAVAADAGGTAIIAWDGVRLVRSTDHGQSWSAPTLLATGSSPVVATGGAGTWIVAFLDQPPGSQDTDVYYARSTDGGLNWTTSALNADAPTDDLDEELPRIATDGAGNWLALWTRHLSSTSRGLLLARSLDDGATWSPPELVATWGIASGGFLPWEPDYELATGGARWLIALSFHDDIFVSQSLDLGLSWSAIQPLTSTPSTIDVSPSIATDGAGSWLVAWQSRPATAWAHRLLTSRSGDDAVTWSAPAPPNSSLGLSIGSDQAPAVVSDGSGNWMTAWGRALTSNFQDILITRGVGPSPTSSLTFTTTNPTSNSTLVDVVAAGFTPGSGAFTCFTSRSGDYPAGPWFGIDPLYDELALQAATLAPPFNGTFDAAGTASFSWTIPGTPGPLGLTLYAVTVEHVAGNIARASPPVLATF